MTVVTLRPSTTTTQTGALTGSSGHAALSDDSDASFIDFEYGERWAGALTDLTLPAGAVVKATAIRARCAAVSAGTSRIQVLALVGLGIYQADVNWTVPTTITVPLTSGGGNLPADDSELDDATLDVIGIPPGSGPNLRVYETYLDVTYVAQPVVAVSAPTGTLTTTNVPVVEWTTTLDTDGGVHEAFEVKVFSDAEYGAGGFTPDTSTPTATSGISSAATPGWSATSWQLDEALPDDTYRAYVRIAQIVGGNYHWSAWDFEEFTVDVDLPGTPSLNATGEDDDGFVSFLLATGVGAVLTDLFEFQRSLDAGTTWEPMRTLEGDDGYLTLPYVVAVGDTSSGADATSHSLTLPAPFEGILEGDMLVAVVGMDGNPTMTWPDGWTEIKDEAGNGSAVRAAVAWKRAVGGETGTITLTTSASEGGGARIHCIRGAHLTSAPEVSTGVSSSGANADPDSLNPSWSDSEYILAIAAMVNDGNVAVTAGPSGYSGFGNNRWANASGAGVATAYTLTAASANPGAFTHTAEDSRAFTIAVRARNPLLTIRDYEAPNGTTVQYRARALHNYNGEFAASDWVTDSASWSSTSWWLKHPNQPELNTEVTVRTVGTLARAGRQGVFQPVGASNVVVIQDTRSPATGQVVLRSLTAAAQDDLDALLDESATLLLQSPDGEGGPDYIRVFGHERTRIVEGLADASKVWEALEFVVVPSPLGGVVAWP